MEYTKLGNTGMDVSRICLGCMGFGDAQRWVHKWVLDEDNSRPVIKKALEHLQQLRSAIPKSVRPERIAENFAIFDFELTASELAEIDSLDRNVRGGPDPDSITLETFGRPIPEA